MRISDWSSDVCSSDLTAKALAGRLDRREEAFLQHDVEHRLSRGAGERVAAIGRTMGADHHAARRLFGREARAHREAAADTLGARHDVGGHAEMFIGVKMAGARDAALDLVEYEHQVTIVATVAKRLEEGLRRGADKNGRAACRERVG